AINLIPTSAGAARAIGVVRPDLKGKVDGMSMRAPVPTGSIVDLAVQVGSEPSVEEINDLFRSKADTGDLEGILQFTDEPIVSSDIVHSSYSSIFDSELTMANGNLVKVFSWYDNEWGYSCRLVDLVARIGQTLPSPVAAYGGSAGGPARSVRDAHVAAAGELVRAAPTLAPAHGRTAAGPPAPPAS